MSDIIIDSKLAKTISSESRTKIIKILSARPHNLSEISEKTDMTKSSAKEHLEMLIESDIIQKIPSENKWTYYKLTDLGKRIASPKTELRAIFMLSISIISTIAGFALMIYNSFNHISGSNDNALMVSEISAKASTISATQINNYPSIITLEYYLLFLGILGIIFFCMIIIDDKFKSKKQDNL